MIKRYIDSLWNVFKDKINESEIKLEAIWYSYLNN